MVEKGVYRFSTAGLRAAVSHAGRGQVAAARVVSRSSLACCRFIDLVIVPTGATIGSHAHPLDEEELYVIIDGEGRMTIDGSVISVGPGDVVVNRPGGTHSLENNGASQMRLVVVDVRYDR